MTWSEQFPQHLQPTLAEISLYIANPLWQELRGYLETTYGCDPTIEYSRCGAAPGWNVKYKRGSRALCTLYPDAGKFVCMVSIGGKEEQEAELLLTNCTDTVQEVYRKSAASSMGRWLMIVVESPAVLADVKKLIALRVKPKEVNRRG